MPNSRLLRLAGASRRNDKRLAKPELEGPGDQKINQHGDAERQDEQRDLLYFHRVFARRGFGRHDGIVSPKGDGLGMAPEWVAQG